MKNDFKERTIDLPRWSSWELRKFTNSSNKREAYIGYEVKWGSISYPLLDKEVAFKPIELYPDLFFGFFEDRMKPLKIEKQLEDIAKQYTSQGNDRGIFLVAEGGGFVEMEVGSEWTTFSHKSDRNKYEKILYGEQEIISSDDILWEMGYDIEDCFVIVEMQNVNTTGDLNNAY